MKLINKLDDTNNKSLYSGKSTANYEMYLRAAPTVDKDGNPLKVSKRYYVFRLLNFQTDERKYPFIVRNEHEYFHKDASGKIIDVKRICCPTTLWAKNKIKENVDKDYCPICKLSYEQNTEAWKNFKTTHTIDNTCKQIAKDTKRRWAVYIPVLVVSDPTYERNNNHLRVLRIAGVDGEASGNEAKSTFNRILSVIADANEKGVTVFNGDEGANIAILCEKQRKYSVKKDGTPIIDPRTGEQKYFEMNCVTDVRLLSNRLHAYQSITEGEIERLNFDETYGKVATKDVLNVFLNENYLDTGASDSDFGDDFSDADFSEPIAKESSNKQEVVVEDDDIPTTETVEENHVEDTDEFTASDIDEDIDETPASAISRITKGKVSAPNAESKVKIVSKAELPKDTNALRNSSTTFSEDELPF